MGPVLDGLLVTGSASVDVVVPAPHRFHLQEFFIFIGSCTELRHFVFVESVVVSSPRASCLNVGRRPIFNIQLHSAFK